MGEPLTRTLSATRANEGNVCGMSFADRLVAAMDSADSLICIGLDPQPARTRPDDILEFNLQVIEATADLVCAYKPQSAFYEAAGNVGWQALTETIAAVAGSLPMPSSFSTPSATTSATLPRHTPPPPSTGLGLMPSPSIPTSAQTPSPRSSSAPSAAHSFSAVRRIRVGPIFSRFRWPMATRSTSPSQAT